jgi:DNA-binding IclR family transcriptional regulator
LHWQGNLVAKKSEARGIQSIEVSGRILNTFLEVPGPAMLKDIAAKTDIPAAQVHAYLSSLKRMELVVQDAQDGRYALGPLALRFGLAYRDSFSPMRFASETLAEIEQSTGFMCALVIWSNNRPTVFEVRSGRQSLNVNLRPGMSFSLIGSSVGAVFAAYLPAETVDPLIELERSSERFQSHQWQFTPDEFNEQRYNAKDCGFVALAGRPIVGLNSVAMPVLQGTDELQGTIWMIGNEASMDVACGADLYASVRVILQGKRP